MSAHETRPLPAGQWNRYDEDIALTPILQAALNSFQAEGYHGTTVRSIATRAGLTMPALYYHHGSKEGILMALLDIAMDDVSAHLDAGLAAAGDDVTQQLSNFVTVVALHTTCRRDLAALHPEYRFLGEVGRKSYTARRNHIYTRLVGVLEQGAAEGIFTVDDSHFTARALLGMLLAITEWYRPGGPATPEQIAASYVRAALNLVGATAVIERRATPRPRVRSRR